VTSLGTDFDALLTRGAQVALVLAGAWALAVTAAVALEARTGGRVRLAERAGCPAFLRLWLLAAFVAVLAAAAPADAGDVGNRPGGHADAGRSPGRSPSTTLDGLPLPDRVSGGAGTAGRATVVVEPGDSLWRIARTLLPSGAPDSVVAATVSDLYAANHRTIGPDPDHLLPGQRLLVGDPDNITEAP